MSAQLLHMLSNGRDLYRKAHTNVRMDFFTSRFPVIYESLFGTMYKFIGVDGAGGGSPTQLYTKQGYWRCWSLFPRSTFCYGGVIVAGVGAGSSTTAHESQHT